MRQICYPNDFKSWVVSYENGKSCIPVEVSKSVKKQKYPQIMFDINGNHFTVEFANETDYMAARDSSKTVAIEMLYANKKGRIKGFIKRIEL